MNPHSHQPYREHSTLLDETTDMCSSAINHLHNREPEPIRTYDNDGQCEESFQMEVENEEPLPQQQEETTIPTETNVSWPIFTNLPKKNNDETFNRYDFQKQYLHFLLELREGRLLPQNAIQAITSELLVLIEILYNIILI